MEAIGLILMMSIFAVTFTLTIYFMNRSRCSLEEAAQLSGYAQQDVRALIQAEVLDYRRKYLVIGPLSLNMSEIAPAYAGYQEIQRIQAESDARIRQLAEEMAAKIAEQNQQFQERMRVQQEELEYMRKAHQEILEKLRAGSMYLPAPIAAAFSVLDLAHDSSFEEVQQCYRQLSKRYHPDAGGTSEQFIRINTAYQTIRNWLESKGNRNA